VVELEPLNGVDGFGSAEAIDCERRYRTAFSLWDVIEDLLNRDDIVGAILPTHATDRCLNAPGHAAYLQSSTEAVLAYVAPMMRQYGFVSPPTTTTWMSSRLNIWIISSGAALSFVAHGSSPNVARG